VGSQANHFDEFAVLHDLIDEEVLHIDPSGVRARQVPDQFRVGRWILQRIVRQSSSESSTPLVRFPVIWMGACDAAVSSSKAYNRGRALVAVIVVMGSPWSRT
jgi:hypothetical protein